MLIVVVYIIQLKTITSWTLNKVYNATILYNKTPGVYHYSEIYLFSINKKKDFLQR